MEKMDKLQDEYPQLEFHYEKDMPEGLSGFILNQDIYINKQNSKTKQLETLAEELGHYETTVGQIVPVKTEKDRIQERKARRWGRMKIVTLRGLIDCYNSHLLTSEEVADYFEISIGYFWDAIADIKGKLGEKFMFDGYYFDLSCGLNIQRITLSSNH